MSMLSICALVAGAQRRVAWVSLMPEGDVSVGLCDRALAVRDFEAQSFVWSAFNRREVAWVVPHEPHAMVAISQPHITFHPARVVNGIDSGEWFHVRGNKGKPMYEAIAPMELAVDQQGIVPWVRFISKPVSGLTEAKGLRSGPMTRVICVPFDDATRSIGVSVDFVGPGVTDPFPGAMLTEFLDHTKYRLRVTLSQLPGQVATLGWIRQN